MQKTIVTGESMCEAVPNDLNKNDDYCPDCGQGVKRCPRCGREIPTPYIPTYVPWYPKPYYPFYYQPAITWTWNTT